MRHSKDPEFQPLYDALPNDIQRLADRCFEHLKSDPRHPSLHFKCLGDDIWSVRVGLKYRALSIRGTDRYQWFWIGTHAEYDRLVR